MRGPWGPLYLLLISVLGADGLRVTMKKPRISVLRDANVTIPCDVSDVLPGQTITVSWKKLENGKDIDMYNYIPGSTKTTRSGAYMEDEAEIQRGNAALHLPRAQFRDDGEYTCMVIVTPDSKEGKSTLHVSAAPSAVLTPGEDIKVELGNERVVSCEVRNFYPRDINIRWVRREKDSPHCVVLERGTYTGDTINNIDGTFNVTSLLILNPTLADDGYRYSCEVKHRALRSDLMKNFTLTVTEPENNTRTIITVVVVTVLMMAAIGCAVYIYYRLKKDPPTLSPITGSDEMIDMNRTTLTCHIINFKPCDLMIIVCLKRSGEEIKEIHTWRSTDTHTGDSNGDIEQQRLMNGDVSHTEGPLQLKMVPLITPNKSGLLRWIRWRRLFTYSCQCTFHFTPSFGADNGAEFSLRVSHPALTAAVSKKIALKVKGVSPTLLSIVSPTFVTHEEPTTLTCSITGFKPKPLQITWLKKDRDNQETELLTWKSNDQNNLKGDIHKVTENEHNDKSYSFQSALIVRPKVQENGRKYICRTYHPATNHQAEEELVPEVTAVPVLGPIKPEQDKVYAGEVMKLSCKIHSFYPKHIDITWRTEEGRSVPANTSDDLPDTNGLYHVTSSMSYTPTMTDRGKTFTCEVKHQSTGIPRKATWKLEHVVSRLIVSDIRCDPPTPECGKMVTLSCDVSDMYPKEFTVQWHKGRRRMPADMCKESFQDDLESGTSRGTVELKFPVDAGCHEEDFRMELIHCGKIIERKFRLFVGGLARLPVLEDIISDPINPSYGQSVTLRCKVINSNSQDLEVRWLKGEKPVEKGQGEEKHITEKDGSISCLLQITVTALDYGKAYTCSVRHKDMMEPLEQIYYFRLPDKPPELSEITARPERPVPGKEAEFTATIFGFTPDIRVKWYKDFNPVPSDAITTSDLQVGKDSLCTCSTTLRFIAQHTDHRALIRCEVIHSVNKKVFEQHTIVQLSGRTSDVPAGRPPHPTPGSEHLKPSLKTRGIQCLTESPRVGEKVTLTCYVDGPEAEFFWRRGMLPIEGEIEEKTEGSGSFSTVTFTAAETDRDCTITCEVNYNFETQDEHFTLKLQ